MLVLASVLGDSWPATYVNQYDSAPNPCGCPPPRHLGNFVTAWDEYPGLKPEDPWTAVVALERSSNVVVLLDCLEDRAPPCNADGIAAGDRVRLEGTLIETTVVSALLDARVPEDRLFSIARERVTAIYAVEAKARYLGSLIGAAIGTASCAIAGL